MVLVLPCVGQENELRKHVAFLADTIGNRYPASEGDKAVRDYIYGHFAKCGLESRLQSFDIVEYVWGSGNLQLLEGNTVKDFVLGHDFAVSGTGAADTLQTGYVVVGTSMPDSLHSCMKDKAVIMLLGHSSKDDVARISIHDIKRAGASACIYVNPPGSGVGKGKSKGNRSPQPHHIPVMTLRHETIEEFLPQGIIDSIAGTVYVAPPSHKIRIATQRHESRLQATNVIGIKKGRSDKYIIVGAHYDTCAPDPQTGDFRRGANDNASGVSVMMMLAEALHNIQTDHNIVFVAFGGEEKGLLGSMSFLKQMTFDKHDITEMINLDMVGMMEDDKLYFTQFNNTVISPSIFVSDSLCMVDSKDNLSDHASFVDAGVASSYFQTGGDPMIHTTADTSDRLNYKGMNRVLQFLTNYIMSIDAQYFNNQ